MKIAVEGCAHGELEKIYLTIERAEEHIGSKVDLLICCGDFQSTRNAQDLTCMAVPKKYQQMCSFHKYYSGEKLAPVLTLFIGGNHEASNYLQELPYGGWVAPNIYYLGYAGVVNVGGVRIGGLSGIFKAHDYTKGHFEKPPYTEETKRTVYHVRNLEVFRLKQIKSQIDIMISHDWPRGVHKFGDVKSLLQRKPFFKDDIENDCLGSSPAEELLTALKPKYWFAAHLHTKFAAIVTHEPEKDDEDAKDDDDDDDDVSSKQKLTKFLALDKCLPKRQFLQILDIPHDDSKPLDLHYDLEWLTILFLTNHLLSVKKTQQFMPGPGSIERWIFSPTTEEMTNVLKRMGDDLQVPLNFTCSAPPYSQDDNSYGSIQLNPQTVEFCKKLSLMDPLALLNVTQVASSDSFNPNASPPRTDKSPNKIPKDMTPNKADITPSKTEISKDVTPNKTDISFVDSESSSPPSFNASMSDLESPILNKFNRSALFLPPPKNAVNDNSDEELEVRRISTQSTASDQSQSDSQTEETVDVKLVETVVDKTGDIPGPKPKTFKRRNQAFYANVDDEY